ncbi:MAG: hypothetical protein BGO87_06210 [Flavobacteriia bacterium 40-80]|nr:MAG: hypothetical protein BGO87_06210 [Flavobacteriia bacterium 40-80]
MLVQFYQQLTFLFSKKYGNNRIPAVPHIRNLNYPQISTYAKKANAQTVKIIPTAIVVESKNVLYFSFSDGCDDITNYF